MNGMLFKGLLIIVSAPSGAGKTTVVNELVSRMSDRYSVQRVVTYTSRALRVGEKEGVDYHILPQDQFKQKIDEGFFLEWSTAYGTYYGTPCTVLDDIAQGTICFLIIDRVGAQQLCTKIPDAVMVWLTVPSIEELRRRLEGRALDSKEQIERRLKRAEIEINAEKEERLYTYHIENNEKEQAVFELEQAIEKMINKSIQSGKSEILDGAISTD